MTRPGTTRGGKEKSPRVAAAWGALFLLVSLPLQWVHYARTRELTTRELTRNLVMPVTDAFPGWLPWCQQHHRCAVHQPRTAVHPGHTSPPRTDVA